VLAATFGLDAGGRNSSLVRTLARLEQFGIIRITTGTIAVRLAVGPLPRRWIDRLPHYLAAAYRASRVGDSNDRRGSKS
jgi:hypothetical protein